ncbi:hypothetical protein F4777DRAFT_560037 [Nemania sp. FL0916]|nr:hypothetical protein F4777DRAFT_560037 [Nemania sp. FL0916]
MCGCQRNTYLAQCKHKERVIERCVIYQLREEGLSFLLTCFPRCRTHIKRYYLSRVCVECEKFFIEKYGGEYQKFIQLFLQYKERIGMMRMAIDPRTVPSGVYLNRESAPARIGAQPFSAQQQPPMPIPMAHISRLNDRIPASDPQQTGRGAQIEPVSKVSGSKQLPRVPREMNPPMPTDPSCFAIGDDSDDDDMGNNTVDDRSRQNISVAPPPARHGSYSRLEHPIPRTHTIAQSLTPIEDVVERTNINLVDRLTEAAEDADLPDVEYIEYEGSLVPRVGPAPKGKGKRNASWPASPVRARPRPSSVAGTILDELHSAIDGAIAAQDDDVPLSSGSEAANADAEAEAANSSLNFVSDVRSATGTAFARDRVAIPPPRAHNGVRGSSEFFQERGLPPARHGGEEAGLNRNRRSASVPPPVVPSVRRPVLRDTSGVQNC